MSQNNTFNKETEVKFVYRENGISVLEKKVKRLEELAHPPVELQDEIENLKQKLYVLIMKVKEMEGIINGRLYCSCKNTKGNNERK
tara:strand:+ start:126 stop:383 length:258 start_codon:yes stop_codon:yes gene_type:complete